MQDKTQEPFGLVERPSPGDNAWEQAAEAQRAHTLKQVKASVDILAEDKHATSPSMVALQDWLAESMRELGIKPEGAPCRTC